MDSNTINTLQDPNTLIILKSIFQSFLPVICLYTTKKTINSYKLHRDFKPKDISDIHLPPDLEPQNTEVDLNRFTEEAVKEVVEEFEHVIKNEFSPELTKLFYNNIENVRIKKSKGILLLGAEANYRCYTNKIKYSIITALYHELFHLSNSYYDEKKKVFYCGFAQHFNVKGRLNNNIYFGDGINEGYTEILTHRYFGKNHKLPKAYLLEVRIVEALEKIVGEKEMEKLYMSANLMGLIENLKQYSSEEDILRFISSVDVVSNHYFDNFLFKNKKVELSVKHIYSFLMEAYIKKLKDQAEKGEITPDEFAETANRYTESLGLRAKVGNFDYNYFTNEYLNSLCSDISNIQKELNNKVSISR